MDGDQLLDSEIKELLQEKLERISSINASEVVIDVNEGRVFLRGQIPTLEQYDEIEMVMDTIQGVQEVINELEVVSVVPEGQPLSYDPFYSDYDQTVEIDNPAREAISTNETEEYENDPKKGDTKEYLGTDQVDDAVQEGHSWNPPFEPRLPHDHINAPVANLSSWPEKERERIDRKNKKAEPEKKHKKDKKKAA